MNLQVRSLAVLPLVLSITLHAAVIQGTVVENQTGHPVARANVLLEPVQGSSGPRRAIRTNTAGIFQFAAVPAGSYFLTASRTGFAPAQYGQKRWQAAGTPIVVGENDSFTVALRLPRFGAISGSVFDENDVGLPDYEVLAYRDTRPPQPVAHGISDDRGVFRIPGLPPGRYIVRSASKQYDDASYLPTFSKETETVEQSFPVQVEMDQQVDRVDVRPIPGRLFTYKVAVTTAPPGLPVTITLVSELGRETVQASSHTFGPVPPGSYEIFAQAPLDRRPGIQDDYRKITLTRNDGVVFVTREQPDTQILFSGAPVDPEKIQVLARRNDMAGPGAMDVLNLDSNGRVRLSAGPWQLAIQPNPAFYVAGFGGPRVECSNRHPEGWNDVVIGFGGAVRFTLASTPGAVHGTVKSSGQAVVGAPVFLEPSDIEPARRLSETFVTRTDIQGQYRFTGLAPGNYRLLASFEYSSADSTIMSIARATPIIIESGGDSQQDLDLYVE
jgi:Carboxypeptidase regulatory-like domain